MFKIVLFSNIFVLLIVTDVIIAGNTCGKVTSDLRKCSDKEKNEAAPVASCINEALGLRNANGQSTADNTPDGRKLLSFGDAVMALQRTRQREEERRNNPLFNTPEYRELVKEYNKQKKCSVPERF